MNRVFGNWEHHHAFYEHFGNGPHYCYFCDEELHCYWREFEYPSMNRFISIGAPISIHHINNDHYNNYDDNIVMCHNDCHSAYHSNRYWNGKRPL